VVRIAASRSQRIRTRTQSHAVLSPSSVKFQVALLKPASGIVGLPIARSRAERCRRHTRLPESCLRTRRNRGCPPPPPPGRLSRGIERGPTRDGPGLEDAVEFEPGDVVQAGSRVLRDHEAAPFTGRPLCARGSSVSRSPLLAIGGSFRAPRQSSSTTRRMIQPHIASESKTAKHYVEFRKPHEITGDCHGRPRLLERPLDCRSSPPWTCGAALPASTSVDKTRFLCSIKETQSPERQQMVDTEERRRRRGRAEGPRLR